MAAFSSSSMRKAAVLPSSCGLSCFFNVTDEVFPNVDIYRIEIERN